MKFSMVSWLFYLCLVTIIPESDQQNIHHVRRSTLIFKGPKGPSAFYFYPLESELVDEESSFRMPSSSSNDDSAKQNTKRSFTPLLHQTVHKRTKEYVRKHINHPMKLFRRVLKILKKGSKRSTQINPPKYFLIPSNIFKKKYSKIKRFIKHGKRRTDIDTSRYHVSIMEKSQRKKKNRISNSTTHSNHIAIRRRSDFVPSYEDNYFHSNPYEQSFDGNKKTIENQMLSVVLKKLHTQKSPPLPYNRDKISSSSHSNSGRLVMDAVQNLNNEQEELIQDINKRQKKKKRLTNLFVRFMEDLTHKLDLDPLTIADMLVKRTTDKRSHVAFQTSTN